MLSNETKYFTPYNNIKNFIIFWVRVTFNDWMIQEVSALLKSADKVGQSKLKPKSIESVDWAQPLYLRLDEQIKCIKYRKVVFIFNGNRCK